MKGNWDSHFYRQSWLIPMSKHQNKQTVYTQHEDYNWYSCPNRETLNSITLSLTQWGRDKMVVISQTKISKKRFLNKNVRISLKISLKFVPKVQINNNPTVVQIMAWRWPGDKPLSEPLVVNLLTHKCVTRPQWVNIQWKSLVVTVSGSIFKNNFTHWLVCKWAEGNPLIIFYCYILLNVHIYSKYPVVFSTRIAFLYLELPNSIDVILTLFKFVSHFVSNVDFHD